MDSDYTLNNNTILFSIHDFHLLVMFFHFVILPTYFWYDEFENDEFESDKRKINLSLSNLSNQKYVTIFHNIMA